MLDLAYDNNCSDNELSAEQLSQLVEGLMLSVSFNPSLIGYKYLYEALIISYKYGDKKLSTELYPLLAKKYKVSWESIEHAIRTSIRDCYCFGDLRKLNDIFHCKIIDDVYVPTNGAFISKVTRLLHHKVKSGEAERLLTMSY